MIPQLGLLPIAWQLCAAASLSQPARRGSWRQGRQPVGQRGGECTGVASCCLAASVEAQQLAALHDEAATMAVSFNLTIQKLRGGYGRQYRRQSAACRLDQAINRVD